MFKSRIDFVRSPYFLAVVAGSLLTGCSTPFKESSVAATTTHSYTVKVVNSASQPLMGVDVKFILQDKGATSANVNNKASSSCFTSGSGTCGTTFAVRNDPTVRYGKVFESESMTTARLPEFFPSVRQMRSFAGSSLQGEESSNQAIVLMHPRDYMLQGALGSATEADLRLQVTRAIWGVRTVSELLRSKLLTHSVSTVDYKGRLYLRLMFQNTSIYNSLRMSRYAIAQDIFDEDVRKLLEPLNETMTGSKVIGGYDVVVHASTQNFGMRPAKSS